MNVISTIAEKIHDLTSSREPEPPTRVQRRIETPLGPMNPAQYAAYVASLTPAPIQRGYEVLECGHRVSPDVKPAQVNCETCWAEYFTNHYDQLVGINKLIADGRRQELVHKFGVKLVKWAERISAFWLEEKGPETNGALAEAA